MSKELELKIDKLTSMVESLILKLDPQQLELQLELEPQQLESKPEPSFTHTDLKNLCLKVARLGTDHKVKVKAILKQNDAVKVNDVKPEKIAPIYLEIEAILNDN